MPVILLYYFRLLCFNEIPALIVNEICCIDTYHIERVKTLFTAIHSDLRRRATPTRTADCRIDKQSSHKFTQLSTMQADADQDVEMAMVGGNHT